MQVWVRLKHHLGEKANLTSVSSFSTEQLGFKLPQEQEKGISKVRNTSQRAFFPTESPGQDIPSHNVCDYRVF